MSGGVGFVSAGKNSSASNRRLLKHTDNVMSKRAGNSNKPGAKLTYKHTSKENLAKFKKNFKAEQKRDFRKQIILGIITTVVVFFILYLILY